MINWRPNGQTIKFFRGGVGFGGGNIFQPEFFSQLNALHEFSFMLQIRYFFASFRYAWFYSFGKSFTGIFSRERANELEISCHNLQ